MSVLQAWKGRQIDQCPPKGHSFLGCLIFGLNNLSITTNIHNEGKRFDWWQAFLIAFCRRLDLKGLQLSILANQIGRKVFKWP